MEDMLRNNGTLEARALELGKLLDDHRGGEVVVMDMRNLNFWTDFFVIATVSSSTHSGGMQKHIKEFVSERGMEILLRTRKLKTGSAQLSGEPESEELGPDEWQLLDLGGIVIHLMTAKARSFYELERLWSSAPLIFKGTGESQSSKSS